MIILDIFYSSIIVSGQSLIFQYILSCVLLLFSEKFLYALIIYKKEGSQDDRFSLLRNEN